jgi:hypothetical protein
MFARVYGRDKPKGLFEYVKGRYFAGGKQGEFLKAVGDGALHTVLLAALAKPEAQSVAGLVQQADAIFRVQSCPDLVAVSHPDQRSTLIQNIIIHDAALAVNERAGALAAALNKLTISMRAWDRLNPGRTSRSTTQRASSVLWSIYGWEVTPRTPAETYCSGVNLDSARIDNADIQRALDELWQATRMARASTEGMATENQA